MAPRAPGAPGAERPARGERPRGIGEAPPPPGAGRPREVERRGGAVAAPARGAPGRRRARRGRGRGRSRPARPSCCRWAPPATSGSRRPDGAPWPISCAPRSPDPTTWCRSQNLRNSKKRLGQRLTEGAADVLSQFAGGVTPGAVRAADRVTDAPPAQTYPPSSKGQKKGLTARPQFRYSGQVPPKSGWLFENWVDEVDSGEIQLARTKSYLQYEGRPARGVTSLTGEFDPGSESTLAACLTHASRARKGGNPRVERRTGE